MEGEKREGKNKRVYRGRYIEREKGWVNDDRRMEIISYSHPQHLLVHS